MKYQKWRNSVELTSEFHFNCSKTPADSNQEFYNGFAVLFINNNFQSSILDRNSWGSHKSVDHKYSCQFWIIAIESKNHK